METTILRPNCATVQATADAVGVPDRKWFIAIVNNNTEKRCSDKLIKMGYEAYVPIQQELRPWSAGKRKAVDKIILPSLVFIYLNEAERKRIVGLPFIHKFMTNRAEKVNEYNRHPLAVVPNEQLNRLKFMLYQSDNPVTIEPTPPKLGDRVVVVRGKLKGLEGNIIWCDEGQSYIVVLLDIFGCAKLKVNVIDTKVV